MSISSIQGSSQHVLTESIEKMGNLLKNMTKSTMNINDKMMKLNVTTKIQGLGENLDIKA